MAPLAESQIIESRRLVVPDWLRIHPSVSSRSSETKNMRSASLRWPIEKIPMRGLPLGVRSMAETSSGAPVSHVSKPGAASRLFSAVASSKRFLAG